MAAFLNQTLDMESSKRRKPNSNLRLITILAWIPAFSLLLPYGVEAREVVPPLCILPMTISAVTGLVNITGKATDASVNYLMDIFCAAFLFSLMIPSFVIIPKEYDAGLAMLGAYGTVPVMVNWVLHMYFVAQGSRLHALLHKTCPHCHGDLRQNKVLGQMDGDVEAGSGQEAKVSFDYAERTRAERPSTDEETARLL